MTITYADFRTVFNWAIGDKPVTATTDTTGSTDKDTAIASSLKEWYTSHGGNNLFRDYWCYVPSTQEERRVESFDAETGTVKVYRPFSAQVATSTPIELHKYRVSDKLVAINRTLDYVKEDGFFNPSYSETLWGQEDYGEEPNEVNKREYTVPSTFTELPQIYLLEAYIGDHTGDDDADTLTDANADWETNELVGYTLYNKTDGSSGTVTANTSTTITATLSGGTGNDWDEDDEYIIQKPDARPVLLVDYDSPKAEFAGAITFYAEIPEHYLIKLVGKGTLSLFTTEASTTELSTKQAEIVSQKAAHAFYEYLASSGQSQDRDHAREEASRQLALYMTAISSRAMGNNKTLVNDYSWWH